jgi:hypothetical protein
MIHRERLLSHKHNCGVLISALVISLLKELCSEVFTSGFPQKIIPKLLSYALKQVLQKFSLKIRRDIRN